MQHRHADRGADDDDRHHRERRTDDNAHRRGELPQPVEPFHPVSSETDVVDKAEAAHPFRDGRDVIGVAESRLEFDLDRGGQGIAFQLTQHVAELDQLGPGAGEGFFFRHIHRGLDLGKGLDILERLRGGFDGGAGEDVRDDLDAFFHAVQRILQVHYDQPE